MPRKTIGMILLSPVVVAIVIYAVYAFVTMPLESMLILGFHALLFAGMYLLMS